MIRMKNATINIKAVPGVTLEEGQFAGYASVFDNVDSGGDVVRRGAFADSLAEYGPDGAGIPCYWGHQLSDPYSNLGQTVRAVEDDHGLLVVVQLDMGSAKAAYVHQLIREGRVRQMSFTYTVLDGGPAADEQLGTFYELRSLKIHEVSVVPIGMNQATSLLGIKAATEAAADAPTISASQAERLGQAVELISAVIAEAEIPDDDDSTEEPTSANDEEPETVKSEELIEAKAGDPDSALAIIALASAGVHLN